MSRHEIVVVKYGSASCTNDQGVDQARLEHYAGQIVEQRHKYDRDVVAVISGSIAVARAALGELADSPNVSKQMLATYGNPIFMRGWQKALATYGLRGGELLVTHHEIDDHQERGMLANTISQHREAGWISLINENDGLSDEEIAKLSFGGDNDGLAARVAKVVGAHHLCLMAEVDGLLDVGGALVSNINPDNIEWARSLAGEPSELGRGGMRSKVDVGFSAAQAGINTHIAYAKSNLEDVINGRVGTNFAAPLAA